MSRIGLAPVSIPKGVEVKVENDIVKVKGPKGELTETLTGGIAAAVEGESITFTRPNESKPSKAKHGLYRALIQNAIVGVSEGYKVEMELVGVGYRASAQGQNLELSLGFSHNVVVALPKEVKVAAQMERGKNPQIALESHDKQLIGMVASKIRSLRKPEPYKGKGIRFKGEQIRRKAGKAAAK